MRTLAATLCIVVISVASFASNSEDASKIIPLPMPRLEGSMSVEHALAHRRSVRRFEPGDLPLSALSQLVWAAQGITDERGFRTAPSAGALFPLEIFVVAGAVSGLAPGIYRYDAHQHHLVQFSKGEFRDDLAEAAFGQDWLARAPAVLVLAADFERTARKYGDRATRYAQMEVGHAAQNVYLQSEAFELGTCIVGAFRDASLKKVLGLPSDLEPLGLMPIGKPSK